MVVCVWSMNIIMVVTVSFSEQEMFKLFMKVPSVLIVIRYLWCAPDLRDLH